MKPTCPLYLSNNITTNKMKMADKDKASDIYFAETPLHSQYNIICTQNKTDKI